MGEMYCDCIHYIIINIILIINSYKNVISPTTNMRYYISNSYIMGARDVWDLLHRSTRVKWPEG